MIICSMLFSYVYFLLSPFPVHPSFCHCLPILPCCLKVFQVYNYKILAVYPVILLKSF